MVKYQRFTPSGYEVKKIKKCEFEGETKFRWFSYCAKILGFEN